MARRELSGTFATFLAALSTLHEQAADLYCGLMESNKDSILDDPVAQLLLNGQARTPSEAERIYLESHLEEVLSLVQGPLSDEEFRRHPLILVLFSHGSRGWEDSVR